MRKKVFAALLAVCMVVAMLPVSAFAEEPEAELKVTPVTEESELTEIGTAFAASKDEVAALAEVTIKPNGTDFIVTGKANFAYFPGFSSKAAEQTGHYIPLKVDYTGKANTVEVYLSSVDGSITWEGDSTGAKYKMMLNGTTQKDTLVYRIDDSNKFTLRVVDKKSEANKDKTDVAKMVYTDYVVDLSGVQCKDVVLDQPFMLDEDGDWNEMIKDATFVHEKDSGWNSSTIGTYPAIAFTYAKNVVIANNSNAANKAFVAFRYRTNTIEKVFTLTRDGLSNALAPVGDTGKNYQMVELVGDLELTDSAKWADTFTITPVIVKATSIDAVNAPFVPAGVTETIIAGESKTVSYGDVEPEAKIEASNKDVFIDTDEENAKKLVAEGTVAYQDGKGYLLNLTITDDSIANSRAMKTVTLKNVNDIAQGANEAGKNATANFDKGVAKVSFDVTADILKKAEGAAATDPDPKSQIVMEITYGYQNSALNNVELCNSKLTYTLDITAVETEQLDEAETEAAPTVTVTNGAAAPAVATIENSLDKAILDKKAEPGITDDAIITVPTVTLNAAAAETVELNKAVLDVLTADKYAVETVNIDNGDVVVGLPAEVVKGEEYRSEAGALTVEVKEVAKPADVADIAKQIEGIERADLEQVYNISVPTAENGVTGLTAPIVLTFKVAKAEDYKVVYIDGSEITIVDSEGKDGILTAKVKHLSTYAVVKESVLVARDPSMAITVTSNEVKKGTLVAGVGTPLTAKLTGDVKAGDVAVFQIMDASGKYSVGVQVLKAGDQDILTYARGSVETVDLFILRGNTIVKSVSELTIK